MKDLENDGCGRTYILTDSDALENVPESHCNIVTDAIREVFQDPRAFFQKIALRTRIPNLAKYLQRFVDDGQWKLVIADTFLMERETFGAFVWLHKDQRFSLFTPTTSSQKPAHPDFALLNEDFEWIHWADIGWSGGLWQFDDHSTLTEYGQRSANSLFPEATTCVFGNTTCGDVLVYNTEGQAGFVSHENASAYGLGSIPEALDWIFGELANNRTPEFDYSRV